MTEAAPILDKVRSALMSEPRIDLHSFPVHLAFAQGVLTVEGEMPNIAAKKLTLEHAAALPEVEGIVDRLRVRPAQAMGDREIRNAVRDALLQEPAFIEIAVSERDKGEKRLLREPPNKRRGEICIRVEDGVVTLDGEVPGLGHKRLAGVLAWWVPGSRDVINGLGVTPPEEDNDGEIADAVRIALEKDVFVNASQIRVGVRNGVVTLAGLVPTEGEREMAEFDAWYVFAVDRVINRIAVRP